MTIGELYPGEFEALERQGRLDAVMPEQETMKMRKNELMYSLFGKSYDGGCQKCKDCCHLKAYNYRGKRYYKCVPYGVTNSEASDWRLSYDACGLFNKDYEGDIPIIKLITHETYDDQIEGQMSLFDGEE